MVSEAKSAWPGDERPGAAARLALQPDHTHYVTVPSGSEEQVSAFRFKLAHAITVHPWHDVVDRSRQAAAAAAAEAAAGAAAAGTAEEGKDPGGAAAAAAAVSERAMKTTKSLKKKMKRKTAGSEAHDVESAGGAKPAVSMKRPPLPCVSLMVSGGPAASREALRSVRLGWPLVVIKGTGGMADRIAAARVAPEDFISDPIITEIVQEANIEVIELSEVDGGITGAMVKRLFAGAQTRNAAAFAAQPNVIMAWDRIRQFEQTAARHRTLGKAMRSTLMALALAAVLIACIAQSLKVGDIPVSAPSDPAALAEVLSVALLVIPIITAMVRSFSAKVGRCRLTLSNPC